MEYATTFEQTRPNNIVPFCGMGDQPKTVITFLPVIRNPITKYNTVLECIQQSQKYAKALKIPNSKSGILKSIPRKYQTTYCDRLPLSALSWNFLISTQL